jgi:hypothetical protein
MEEYKYDIKIETKDIKKFHDKITDLVYDFLIKIQRVIIRKEHYVSIHQGQKSTEIVIKITSEEE